MNYRQQNEAKYRFIKLTYMQPTMAPTSSRLLVELSTDEHKTTFMNVILTLSNLTYTLMVYSHWLSPGPGQGLGPEPGRMG